MKMYPDRDNFFKFMQDHVIINQPMKIVFRAKETVDTQQLLLIHVTSGINDTRNAIRRGGGGGGVSVTLPAFSHGCRLC